MLGGVEMSGVLCAVEWCVVCGVLCGMLGGVLWRDPQIGSKVHTVVQKVRLKEVSSLYDT